MISQQVKKGIVLLTGAIACFGLGTLAMAVPSAFSSSASGIGAVALQVSTQLSSVAKLITGGAYVGGFAFAVGAIVKFKAHKDAPQQVPISQPIALLFVSAALIFLPSVFKTTGATLFGSSSTNNNTSGVSSF